MQTLLCTPASTFVGLEMPSLEIVIVCAVPLMMMLQQWASKPSLTLPPARQYASEQAPPPDTTTRQNAQAMTSVEQLGNDQAPSSDILQTISGAPDEIRSMVGQFLSNSDVAAVSSVCPNLNQAFWNSESVWMALGARDDLSLGRSGVAEYTRDAYRRAAFRIDCSDLAALAGAPRSGFDANVFDEASHVLKGLMQDDCREIQLVCSLVGPALESLNFAAAGAAEAFLRTAHDRIDLFSNQDLETLDCAYDYALLQHNLMMDTMEEHQMELEEQMQSVEQEVCNDHWSLILDQ